MTNKQSFPANNNLLPEEKMLPRRDLPNNITQALEEKKKDKIIDDTDTQEEDEISEEIMDVDESVEKAGIRSDKSGPRELNEAGELNANAKND